MTNTPPLFTDRLRTQVAVARCSPTGCGWLIQVLDQDGEVVFQHPHQAPEITSMARRLASEGVVTSQWRSDHGTWIAQARAA